jgi:hypothetical protein
MATPGIKFTGTDKGGGLVQIENLTPVVTIIQATGSTKVKEIQITIPFTKGEFVTDKPAKLEDWEVFLALKGVTNILDLTDNRGNASFQHIINEPNNPVFAFGMRSNNGKVGGPGLLPFKKLKKPRKKS